MSAAVRNISLFPFETIFFFPRFTTFPKFGRRSFLETDLIRTSIGSTPFSSIPLAAFFPFLDFRALGYNKIFFWDLHPSSCFHLLAYDGFFFARFGFSAFFPPLILDLLLLFFFSSPLQAATSFLQPRGKDALNPHSLLPFYLGFFQIPPSLPCSTSPFCH